MPTAAGAGSSAAPVAGAKRPRPAAAATAAPTAPVFVVTDALRQLAKERAARAAATSQRGGGVDGVARGTQAASTSSAARGMSSNG